MRTLEGQRVPTALGAGAGLFAARGRRQEGRRATQWGSRHGDAAAALLQLPLLVTESRISCTTCPGHGASLGKL